MDKVIKGLERCLICDISVIAPEEAQNAYRECEYTVGLYCGEKKLLREAITLLKEQEAKIEQLNRFVNGFSRDAMPVVRCKDCKNRPKEPNWKTYESGFDLEFPEGSKCPCRCCGDEWYSWYPENDWFCANGDRRTDDD